VDVPVEVWAITVAVLICVIVFDLLVVTRKPHEPSLREAGAWSAFYVALALVFAGGLWVVEGGQMAAEFTAGYLTEKSLSVDNLFVFVVILTAFAVPRIYQQRVLLYGIVLALVMRTIFIALGAAAIARLSWTFYVFGAFLVYTGVQLGRKHGEEPDLDKNPILRWVERVVPTTREYHGTKTFIRQNGRRLATPMFIVLVAIGLTDLLFALDSIPAIFGLTQEPYLVFTANAFALMGLRQLFFLLDGLLDRLVYLSYGLAFILVFIGVKLLLIPAHETWPAVPHIPTLLSLGVIILTLAITVVASLIKVRRDPSAINRHEVIRHTEGDELDAVGERADRRHSREEPDPRGQL
jgi:tellurite resistance protein TerC